MRLLSLFVSGVAAVYPAQITLDGSVYAHPHDRLAGPIGCPANSPLSCHNSTTVENMCCFSHPGGQMLLTQFWDTNPATGPDEEWTLHGLWPDHCDGSFDVYCDKSRKYSNISAILTHFGKDELLAEMHQVWKDFRGHDESLWGHEWDKHGTCTNTLNPECYDPATYEPTLEVVHYLEAAVSLHRALPSFKFLDQAGIRPSTTETYTYAQIQAALTDAHDAPVTLGCRGARLTEIWYHYSVRGGVLGGMFVPSEPDGMKSTCPQTGIRYLPKHRGGGGRHPPAPKPPKNPSGPSKPWDGRGQLAVREVGAGAGARRGCLISKGDWFTSGTCATFTAVQEAGGEGEFTLHSRRGTCGFVDGELVCAKAVEPARFVPLPSDSDAGGKMAAVVDGRRVDRFYAEKEPTHAHGQRLRLRPDGDASDHGRWVEVEWAGQ